MKRATRTFLHILVFVSATSLSADSFEAPAHFEPPAARPEPLLQPRLLFEATAMEPAESLAAARHVAAAELASIGAWNSAGRLPQKIGFVRHLQQPLHVELEGLAERSFAGSVNRGLLQGSPGEGFTWVTRIEATEANRLRLRLRAADLPEDIEMMVYNERGEVLRFGTELRAPDGELWTPSVGGPTIFFEIHCRQADQRLSFNIDAVSESFELDENGWPLTGGRPELILKTDTSCIIPSACVGTGTLAAIGAYRSAVAQLRFIEDGAAYNCSGGLLNDQDPNGSIPYMLTANHCFSSQAPASSLEAFWDFHETSCGGTIPDPGTLPRSLGSTLLASSPSTDFTFLRLNSAPAGVNGRTYLGSTTSPPAEDNILYGLHHPDGQKQAFSRSSVDRTPASICGSPVDFMYLNPVDGATFGGSSGSPITNSNLQVVGQLLGVCGPNSDEPCFAGSSDHQMYGAFSVTFNSIAQWLAVPGSGPCVDSPTTLCLLNHRFKVQATYRTAGGQTGAAQAVRLTNETGYFWFFSASNIEAVFKLLNACTPGLGNHFWVFAGGLTDVEVTTTVTDTGAAGAGSAKTYFNPLGTPFQPISDLNSFATCP
jgi:lysyl endopeptidase